MAHLTLSSPGGTRQIALVKRITTVGRAEDCDVRLDDPRAPQSALHISTEEGGLRLTSHDPSVLVNGKAKREHTLAEGDRVRVGHTELLLSLAEAAAEPSPPGEEGRAAAALPILRRLTAFSEALLGAHDLERLLEQLMDEVIDLTRADKGFLILLEGGDLRVKVARNLARENIEDAVERLSDSIVSKVVRSRQPIVISDALDDPEFKASQSVVNLKLLSVMCVPLMHRGELFGLIYVGNDRLVNRFEREALDLLTIFSSQASLLLQNALLVNDLRLDNLELRKRLDDQQFGEIVGSCAGMREIFRKIEKIALTDISVLITGETGTGKELIARELHRRSPRAKGPFVTINCGAIPENLLESELFGHAKGAFTGAVVTRGGRFQAASGGTLFLDEIGEMPQQLQVKLLRALQEKVVYKVGDHRGEPVDIRVLAATNKILEDEVARGAFREDLYYRLNVVTLRMPPLRERGDDLVVLARFFLQRYTVEYGAKVRGFSPAATVALRKYAWPGNIRELENRLKKAVVLADRPLLAAEDLDLRPENLEPILPLALAKEEFQKRYINEILERNGGNRTKTAKDLGVDPRTIFRHLEKLDSERDEGSPEADAAPGALERG